MGSVPTAMAEIEGQVKEEELDPEREARRRFSLAQIRQYPDAALKMAARPVVDFDDELRGLRRADDAADGGRERDRARRDAGGRAAAPVRLHSRPRTRSPPSSTPRSSSAARRPRSPTKAASRSRACSCPWSGGHRHDHRARRERGGGALRARGRLRARRAARERPPRRDADLDRTTPEARREALAMLRPRIVLT